MGLPNPAAAYTTNNDRDLVIGICESCWRDLRAAQTGPAPKFDRRNILEPIEKELRTSLVETCAAALAEHRLGQKSTP